MVSTPGGTGTVRSDTCSVTVMGTDDQTLESTSTRVGPPSRLKTRRWSPSSCGWTDAMGTTMPVGTQRTSTRRGTSADALAGLDRLGRRDLLAPVGPRVDQGETGGEHRQHRRRGDSSTAAVQPAVPAGGDPFEPMLGGSPADDARRSSRERRSWSSLTPGPRTRPVRADQHGAPGSRAPVRWWGGCA